MLFLSGSVQAKELKSILETVDVETGVRTVVRTFDGRSIAVSHDPDPQGSRIYTMPLRLDDGLEPRPSHLVPPARLGRETLATEVVSTPRSYLHGWSPDGKWLAYCAMRETDPKGDVYIAYRKGDLEPGQHLPDLNVELRLMSAEGGPSRPLARLFGGQGTINVNSWSPDSKRLAFVSYRIPQSHPAASAE